MSSVHTSHVSSPSKKIKESSLKDFYRRDESQHQNGQGANTQSKIQSLQSQNVADSHAFSPNLSRRKSKESYQKSSPLVYNKSKLSNFAEQQQSSLINNGELDLSSNMKIQMGDIFQNNHQVGEEKRVVQTEVIRVEQKNFLDVRQGIVNENGLQKELEEGEFLKSEKFKQEYSDFDYDLSIEPEEIKFPRSELQQEDSKMKRFEMTPLNSELNFEEESNLKLQSSPNTPSKKPNSPSKSHTNSPFTKSPSNQKSELLEKIQFNHFKMTNSNLTQEKSQKKDQTLIDTFGSPKKQQQKTQISQKEPSIHSQQKQQDNHSVLSDDDALNIITQIKELQNEVSNLKESKYKYAIRKFKDEKLKEMQQQLRQKRQKLDKEYLEKELKISKELERQKQACRKSLEDIEKYRKTFEVIIQKLGDDKANIQSEYLKSLEKIRLYKEKMINEWKRQSNEDIKRAVSDKPTVQVSSQQGRLNKGPRIEYRHEKYQQ